MEDFTIEVRDGRGVPRVQARVNAPNMALALALAAANQGGTEWVFLQELSGDELARMLEAQTASLRRAAGYPEADSRTRQPRHPTTTRS